MQFCHQRTTFLTLNLQFACFVWSKMSVKGIIMFLGMNNTRLERKILIILDFENVFLPTYLLQCPRTKLGQKLLFFTKPFCIKTLAIMPTRIMPMRYPIQAITSYWLFVNEKKINCKYHLETNNCTTESCNTGLLWL